MCLRLGRHAASAMNPITPVAGMEWPAMLVRRRELDTG